MILRSLFWGAVGALGALALDRWIEQRRQRWSPNAVTGRLLDALNDKLEQGGHTPAR